MSNSGVQAARKAGLRDVEDRLVAMGAPRPTEPAPPRGWLRMLLGRGGS